MKKLTLSLILLFSAQLAIFAQCPSCSVYYVDIDATGNNDGTSWADAFTNLQEAMDAAVDDGIDGIWVAEGTYLPTQRPDGVSTTDPRDRTFHLDQDLKIFGGFEGTETDINERDAQAHPTVLSGDFDGDDEFDAQNGGYQNGSGSENAYHVFITANLSSAAELDGFHIQGGNADGTGSINYSGRTFSLASGGGIYNIESSPTITNCTFSGNTVNIAGGGIYNVDSSPTLTNCTFSGNMANNIGGGMVNVDSSPMVTNCTFSGNYTSDGAGGMYNQGGSPIVTGCIFSGNTADNIGGGGMVNVESSPAVTNCIFSKNTSNNDGGGMYNNDMSSPMVTNCTFSGNTATNDGGGIYNDNMSSPIVSNCILWGNSSEIDNDATSNATVSHSIVQGGYSPCTACPGTDGNVDPLFVSASDPAGPDGIFRTADDGLALLPCSAAIDAGTDTDAPANDILGNARVNGDNQNGAEQDIGAYEYQTVGGCSTRIYVDIDATGNENGTSWADAFTDLQTAMDAALSCGVDSIWVAEGTYLPTQWPDGVSTADPRDRTFHLDQDLKIFGGFEGTETDISERDAQAHPTVLSGDFNDDDEFDTQNGGYQNGSGSENAIHVFITADLTDAAELDGLQIQGGNANVDNSINYSGGNFDSDSGGGIYNIESSPTITNCTFSGNAADVGGGGMYNDNSSPTLTNCTFSGNAANYGGGMDNSSSSSPTVTGCTFSGNTASFGGGMENFSSSSPTVTGCTFSGNTATNAGGGMDNFISSSPTVTNCTFSGNTATNNSGGIYNYDNSSPIVSNCILWGNGSEIDNVANSNATVSHSIVQGGYSPCTDCPGTDGNVDPLFVIENDPAGPDNILGTADDGLALLPCSAGIDAGDNTALPAGITTDLTGNPRFYNTGTVDLGAYELQSPPTPVVAICQDQTVTLDSGGNGSLSVASLNNGSTGCGPLNFRVNGAATLNFGYVDAGQLQVTLTVSDSRPRTGTCTATITIEGQPGSDNCSPGPVMVEDNPIGSGIYRSGTTMSSTGAIPASSEVLFTAGESITLQPGFTAAAGATFTARIEDCIPPSANAGWGGQPSGEVQTSNNPEMGQAIGGDELKVFPNPFRNRTTIALDLSVDQQVGIHLFGMNGRLVERVLEPVMQPAGTQHYTLDGSRLAPGVYILAVQIGGKLHQRRLVVLR